MDPSNTDLNSVIDDFSSWKSFLGDQVSKAHSAGLSDEQITAAAVKMGQYLADKIDPSNPQNRLLRQMWDVGTPEDQKSLARMMINLVQKTPTH